jgi:hypothetical protein
VGRVVFTGSAKPVAEWSGSESRRRNILAPSRSPTPSTEPFDSVAVDPSQRESDAGLLPYNQDIQAFETAVAASRSVRQ